MDWRTFFGRSRGNAPKKKGGGAALALVPLGVAVIFGTLVLPRNAPPEEVPMPRVDGRALESQALADHALAEQARAEPLPPDVRALGSALRAFHALEAAPHPEEILLRDARRAVDDALPAAQEVGGLPALMRLRAVQLEGFLEELRRFEDTGEESAELAALGGRFVARMRREGWCKDHTLVPGDAARRALFKQMWSAFVGLEARAEFAPSQDELRSLYGFYLQNPHPSDAMRETLAGARRAATSPGACAAIDETERRAAEAWRLERIQKLAAIDPTYPAAFARGVVLYRRGDFTASANAFRDWLHDHPQGPLAVRAENHMRAALVADLRAP